MRDENNAVARPFRKGAIDALMLPAWVLGVSMVGVGSLARDMGASLTGAMASTIFVWAGPAQVVFFTMMGAGASLAAVALAVTLTAIRLMPMTASLMPLLRGGAPRSATLVAASHFVAVTTWVEAMRRLPHLPAQVRLPYYFGFAVACVVIATLGTAAGHVIAGAAPVWLAAGMLFMTPAFFTLSLLGSARVAADWAAVALGFGLTALFGVWVGPAAALFLAGLLGGTAAFLWHWRSA